MDLSRARAFATLQRYSSKDIVPLVAKEGIANDVIAILPYLAEWATPKAYVEHDTVTRHGWIISCITPHDTGIHPDWTPEAAPALWKMWHATAPEYAQRFAWRHALDNYQAGEYMIWGDEEHPDSVYRCMRDETSHTPGAYPEAWEVWPPVVEVPVPEGEDHIGEVTEMVEEPGDGDAGNPATGDYPAWVPWDGNNDNLHQVGDRVAHQGQAWESIAPNNHWEPGVYGWEVVNDD